LNESKEPPSKDDWMLVRNARQLLTLQGASGPRRGTAMSELGIVPNGALLIRNGMIEHVGSARRLENLAGARRAREIDATGKIVMPAFVDADVALVTPAPLRGDDELEDESTAIRVMSRKRVNARASAMALECVRYGALSVGAHTRCAADLQNIGKVLRVYQAMQMKPLRIRSIFSPRLAPGNGKSAEQMMETLVTKWLPSIKQRKLSGVVELTLTEPHGIAAVDSTTIRAAAVAAAGLGFAIRLRSSTCPEPADLQLALAAGAMGIVAPMDRLRAFAGPLSAVGCVRVIPASEGFDDAVTAADSIRQAIKEGAAIAIASSYRLHYTSSLNMQYLLHLAVHALGLTEEEAIMATTWNAACSLRLSHVAGALEPGRPADLIMMDVPDYRELARRAGHHDASLIMRGGQILYRTASLSVN
jgi:imidazolonepropionase